MASQARSSLIDGAAGLPPSLPQRQTTEMGTGNHIVHILRALQQLQPRVPGPSATSSHLSNESKLEDGAAAWMCSHLDQLWESTASSITTAPSADANTTAATPTHPRTRLILQLLTLEVIRQERRRGASSLAPPLHSSVSSATPFLGAPSVAPSPVSAVAAPATCSSLRCISSSYHHTRFEKGGLPLVHHWLWQRAAALPSGLVVAKSPYGDLSALMMEWATLALPAWRESSEEMQWRRECEEALRLAHVSAAAATACSLINPAEGAREAKETSTAVPDLVQQSIAGAVHTFVANGVSSLSSNQEAPIPQVKDVNDKTVTAPSLATLPGPLLTSAADGTPPSRSRRVLRLVVGTTTTNPADVQQVGLTIANTTAVAPLPSPSLESEETQVKKTLGGLTSASGNLGALLMKLPPQPQAVDTPAMSSANAIDGDNSDVGVNKRLAIQLSRSSSSSAIPPGAATDATTIIAGPSCGTAVSNVKMGVARRPLMPLSDEDVMGEDDEAQGLMIGANDGALHVSVPVSPALEAGENTGVCMQSRLHRWRRLAPVVLDAPPGSEAAQNALAVLQALGFATTGESGLVDKSLIELTPSCCSAQSSGGSLKGPKVSPLCHSSQSAAHAPTPRSPLGRLPPLLAAHAWLVEPSLRSSWLAHIIAVPSLESSLAVGDGGSELCPKDEQTALVSSRDPQTTPLPVSSLLPSLSVHCRLDTLPRLQLPEASPALPCIALADHRVFTMLDELLWCPHTSARAFLLHFEENLHEYLCYPLAGVCPGPTAAAAPTGSAVCQSHQQLEQGGLVAGSHGPFAPRLLTLSAWKAYLELRYGKTHLRHPKRLHHSLSTAVTTTKAAVFISSDDQHAKLSFAAAAAATRATAGGSHRSDKCEARELIDEDEAAPQPKVASVPASAAAVVARTPLSPFAIEASAASSSATASTATYAALMDVAAMVFLAELRRVGAIIMVEKARSTVQSLQARHARCSAGQLHKSAQQRSGDSGDSAESVMGVKSALLTEGMRQCPSATAGAADASCFKAVQDGCGVSVSSLQALLEDIVESDTTLLRYVCRWLAPVTLPPVVITTNNTQDSRRDVGHDKYSLVTAAARLWLALVTVLSLGESATAQYVRSVLMSPPCLPAIPFSPFPTLAKTGGTAAETVGVSSPPMRTSLAPFTMPTLFRSTLEDLYQEECAAAAAAAAAVADSEHSPPCRQSSPPLCGPGSLTGERGPAKRASASCRAAPTFVATATLQGRGHVAPATQDTLALSAAVALRHPRVILRQLHFLWQLSYGKNYDANMTKTDSSSHRTAALNSTIPAPPDTEGTAASSRRAAGAAGYRGTAKNAGENTVPSFKEEFATRVASLVECVELASLAGLPPPLAASLMPSRPSSSAVPAEASRGALSEDASVPSMRQWPTTSSTSAASVPAVVALLQQPCSAVDFPPLSPPAAGPASTVTAPAASIRLRLQLLSKPSSSSSVTAAVGAFKSQATDGVKRPRELHGMGDTDLSVTELAVLSSSTGVVAGSSQPTKLHRVDSVATRSLPLRSHSGRPAPPPPPPPLESFGELHVRWAEEVQGRSGAMRFSLEPSTTTSSGETGGGKSTVTRSVLLLSVVADALWDVLQHVHARIPGVALGPAHVSGGDGPVPASDPSAVTSASSSVLVRDAKETAGGASVRRTLLLLPVSTAYRALQRLWQAINLPIISECDVTVPSETGTLFPTGGAAVNHPRLDVVLPATASSGLTPAVDLRMYTSLTASLRGVVCLVLGYAVHECLQAIWRMWCAPCNTHESVAATASCAMVSSDLAPPSPCAPFPPLYGSYAWLAGQLSALHEHVLQPLNRILKVPVLVVNGMEPIGNYDASDVVGGDRHVLAAPVALPLRQPSAAHAETLTTAAWLTYSPLGLVLLPAVIRQLDAAMPPLPRGECAVTSGGLHTLNAREAWARVKAALQQAGVQA
ncbi:hypothetical protein Q4I28_001669 [Leishmania naiffi]|uniref:Uncharacterized protein n=1 Tax=Leishmania naiffi TaxID=5678 RepID=A0AAW3C7A6_9TRYP